MLARHAVLLTPSRSSRPPQLLSRQQLARPSNSFSCNTYKKRGGGGLIVNQKSDEGFLSRATIGREGPLLPSGEGFLSRATIGREGPLLPSGEGFLSQGAQRRGISLALRRASLSRASRREVPLAPTVLRELKGLYSRSDDHSPRALVFSTDQGAPLSAVNLRKKALRTACKRADLQRIDWHTFRHTHAPLLHSHGTPLKLAQAHLGHTQIATPLAPTHP